MQIAIGMPIGYPVASAKAAGIFNYLLNDTFTTDRAAGAIDGTMPEPGPGGKRSMIDSATRASIASGDLVFTTSAANDPRVAYAPISVTRGRALLMEHTPATTGLVIGFGATSSATNVSNVFQFNASGLVGALISGSVTVGSYSAGVRYKAVIIHRAPGYYWFLWDNSAQTWRLLGRSTSFGNAGQALSPVFGARGVSSLNCHGFRIPALLWSPVPLLSDGFSVWGTSDGLGHQEGIDGGVGRGGAGVSWVGTGWSVATGKATNTPTKGAQLLTDGALDVWASSTNLTNWVETIAGTSTVTQETTDVRSGSAAKLTCDASNNLAKIAQTLVNSNGDLLLISLWAKTSVAGRSIAPDENSGGISGQVIPLTTAYAQYTTIMKASKANTDIGIKRSTMSSAFALLEDVTVQTINLLSATAWVSLAKADVLLSAAFTLATGSLAGLIVAADSSSAPTNFALIVVGTNLLQVFKVVAGVLSAVSATAITIVTDGELVVRKQGSEFRCLYNNAAVVTATIADAGIVSNTIHGVISTDSTTTIDNVLAHAVDSAAYATVLDNY